MAEFAFVEFRDSFVGRQAYVQGSSLAVWEVIMILRAHEGDVEKTAAYLGWPAYRVQAAVNYARAYPHEIDTAIDDNAAYDAERICRMLPQTRALTIVDGELVEDTKVHVRLAPLKQRGAPHEIGPAVTVRLLALKRWL